MTNFDWEFWWKQKIVSYRKLNAEYFSSLESFTLPPSKLIFWYRALQAPRAFIKRKINRTTRIQRTKLTEKIFNFQLIRRNIKLLPSVRHQRVRYRLKIKITRIMKGEKYLQFGKKVRFPILFFFWRRICRLSFFEHFRTKMESKTRRCLLVWKCEKPAYFSLY